MNLERSPEGMPWREFLRLVHSRTSELESAQTPARITVDVSAL